MNTIPAILDDNAAKWPDRAAIIETRCGRDATLTFSTLRDDVRRMAEHLLDSGVRPKDAVLVFIPMSLRLYVTLLALFRIGAVAVFIDPAAGRRHIRACCECLPPAAVIASRPVLALRFLFAGLRRIPRGIVPTLPRRARARGAVITLPPFPAPDDAALVTFTSGSTGTPKAIVRTHRFLIAQHNVLQRAIELVPGETALTTLPVFVLANLASGVTTILPDAKISRPGFVRVPPLARQIARLAPTRTEGSPAFYERLLRDPASLKNFRKIYLGGAPLFPELMRRLREQTNAKIVLVYGSSEAEPIAECPLEEMRDGDGLPAGRVVPELELRIIADQWGAPAQRTDALPLRAAGEIIVTGEHVLQGYLNGVGDAETKIKIDGKIWHRTGDAGYLDSDNRLWLLGRCSAKAVLPAGRAIYPFPMECAAMKHPFVRRAAFLANGQDIILAIQPTNRLAPQQTADLRQTLAPFPPHKLVFLKKIPVDTRHNAKIDYPALRKLVCK